MRMHILGRKIQDRKDEVGRHVFQTSLDPNLLVEKVADYYKIEKEDVFKRKFPQKSARRVVMCLCALNCCSRVSLTL